MSTNAPSRPDKENTVDLHAQSREQATPMLPRLLITAGPTHEPIDSVRYLANRSTGRLGIELAQEASRRKWPTTLLLGPTSLECSHTHARIIRFSSSADLENLLSEHVPECDCLIMAAAVSDFRPIQNNQAAATKIRRQIEGLTLQLEATPDLLAGVVGTRKPGQLFVGFALEPRESMLESARAKLLRKKIDLIVANPLETMDSLRIEATLLEAANQPPSEPTIPDSTPGPILKTEFAKWLLDRLAIHLC